MNENLTSRQKYILKKMRDGCSLNIEYGLGYLTRKRKPKIYLEGEIRPLLKSTYTELVDKKLITHYQDQFILTTLGKHISLL